jgi:choline kinase
MKAIILAAGRSRRLFPITNRKPKCLLTINDVSLIDRLLNDLKSFGITEVVMVTGFRASMLSRLVTEAHPDVKFSFINNEEYAETLPAYGLWMVKEELEHDVLYLNSDVLCDSMIIKEIIEHRHPSVTAIQKNNWDAEQVKVVTDDNSRVVEIGKNISEEMGHGEFIGITKFGKEFNVHLKEALDSFVKAGDRKRFAVDAINLAIQNGGIFHAHDVSKYKAHEIDTIEDYEHAKKLEI